MGIIIAGVAVAAWMYTICGVFAMTELGMTLNDMPQWWVNASGIAVLTLIIVIAACVKDGTKNRSEPRTDPRRLGVIHYVNGRWVAVREDKERQ